MQGATCSLWSPGTIEGQTHIYVRSATANFRLGFASIARMPERCLGSAAIQRIGRSAAQAYSAIFSYAAAVADCNCQVRLSARHPFPWLSEIGYSAHQHCGERYAALPAADIAVLLPAPCLHRQSDRKYASQWILQASRVHQPNSTIEADACASLAITLDKQPLSGKQSSYVAEDELCFFVLLRANRGAGPSMSQLNVVLDVACSDHGNCQTRSWPSCY